LRFIVDAQLPPALARALTQGGFPATHVFDMGLSDIPDNAIWSLAKREGTAVITKDEDFALFRAARKDGPVVVWLRVGNTANSFLIPWLLPLMPQVAAAIKAGDTLIELR
jgi:predicted nuclease of predicted toxin-antitoxin system